MDNNLVFGIAGIVLSVASLLYAIYVTRKSKLEKELVCEAMGPVPVAEVIKGQSAYSLQVIYKRPNEKQVYIEHAFAQYIRFINFGRIPIKRGDLADADPLRIEAVGGKVLDISMAGVTRDVCQIQLGPLERNEAGTYAKLEFDFLDHMDGGLIQILSDDISTKVNLQGTVVGMPFGVKKLSDTSESRPLPNWGCAGASIILVLSIAGAALIYRWVVGSWNNVWLLVLPFAALALPFLFIFAVFAVLEPRQNFDLPRQLLPPRWYHMRRMTIESYPSFAEDDAKEEERPQRHKKQS